MQADFEELLEDPFNELVKQAVDNGRVPIGYNVMANMGCKKTAALYGMLRESCRKKDIPLLIIEQDVVDPRTVTHRRITEQIDDFMENTMGAKRLDGAG